MEQYPQWLMTIPETVNCIFPKTVHKWRICDPTSTYIQGTVPKWRICVLTATIPGTVPKWCIQPGHQPQHCPHHVQYELPGQCHVTVVQVQPSNSGSYGQILERFYDYELIICFQEFWKKTDRCARKQFNQLLIFPFYNNVYMQTVFVIFISLLPLVLSDHATSDATYASTSCS